MRVKEHFVFYFLKNYFEYSRTRNSSRIKSIFLDLFLFQNSRNFWCQKNPITTNDIMAIPSRSLDLKKILVKDFEVLDHERPSSENY